MKDTDKIIQAVFGCGRQDISAKVILTPFLSLKSFKVFFKDGTRNFYQPKWFHGFTGSLGGQAVSVINCGLGAQRTADCVHFLSLAKVKHVLLVGAAGGLSPLKIGALILAGRGGRHQAASAWLKKALQLNEPTADVFSLPSLADWQRSHRQKLFKSLKNKKFLAVDLETTAFYEAAHRDKIDALALHFISDCPDRKPFWEPLTEEENDLVNRAKDKIPLLALAVVSQCR